LPLFVDEERELDFGVFAELASVGCVSQADGHKPGAFFSESIFVRAQLRDVLTAEDSTVVAEEDNGGETAGPQAAQLYGLSIQIS